MHELAVIGGGLMGCSVALRQAREGRKVVLIEARSGLCTQASGVNSGHIDVMGGRPYRVPYILRGIELWRNSLEWLGVDVGYERRNGLKVAFTEADEAELVTVAAKMREYGGELEIIGAERAREFEPGLSSNVRAAVLSRADGFANPLTLADGYTRSLAEAGVEVHLRTPVMGIEAGEYFRIRTEQSTVTTRQLLISGGVWIAEIARMLGVDLPMSCRVSQVTVTERQPPLVATVLNTASDTLSLKQVTNGTVLIGGGWQGIGSPSQGPREVIPEHLIGNLQLACAVIPRLAQARIVRTWLGLEARAADNLPLVGPVPGVPGAWILGAVHTGFALGPAMAELMSEMIAERRDTVPLFNPARLISKETGVVANA